uniref:Pheromone-binding protein 2 n=1 Tax=Agrotis ipsilon TaxID=56364 RepID=I6QNQ5_AGRIP|nr:pheromone-binding protein 2 [Agrotis ipsilon]
MAASRWCIACLVCVLFAARSVMTSQEVVASFSKGFTNVVEHCKAEVNAGEHIMQDIYNFWREEYQLVNRDLGCMVLCMANKLGLIGEDQKMHHAKAEEFAKSHGADEAVAKQLVAILYECETKHAAVEDECGMALEIAKCFRTKMHELKWAPSMEVAMEEIMTAV